MVQETLHFDPVSGRISSLRSKEEAHDYRYFPEPDLVPIVATEEMLEAARAALPELPLARAARLQRDFGLAADRAHELAFRTEQADYFERVLSVGDGVDPTAAANWMPQLAERIGTEADPAESNVTPESFAALVEMVSAKQVSRDAAREVLSRLVADGGEPGEIVEREGLGALSADDGGLEALVAAAIAADPAAAEKVRAGNAKAMGPLVGYVMRETKGRADGAELNRLIRVQLGLD